MQVTVILIEFCMIFGNWTFRAVSEHVWGDSTYVNEAIFRYYLVMGNINEMKVPNWTSIHAC